MYVTGSWNTWNPTVSGRDLQFLRNENDPVSQSNNAVLKPYPDLLLLFGISLLLPQWPVRPPHNDDLPFIRFDYHKGISSLLLIRF